METKNTKKTNKIIIIAKEWLDRIYGNSYFAVKIELENETLFIPFSYGYEQAYLYAAIKLLIKEKYIPATVQNTWTLKNYCDDKKIVLHYAIQRNCLKRELKQLVSN
jgi:hypothetical protein